MRVDLAGFTRGAKRLDHGAVLDFCARMDRLGYDGIWFNEFHFQQPPDPYPSTLLLAAGIFARTERMRVGTSILVLPLYHPFLLAEQIAQLHWQSGGRFDLGIGRGTFPAFGQAPASLSDHCLPQVTISRSMSPAQRRSRLPFPLPTACRSC